MRRGEQVLDAALKLAAAGTPVFPCLLDKRPATPHGFKNASADSDAVRELWRQYPAPLIGVPTGDVAGFDVLDLDSKHAAAKQWWRNNHHRLPPTRTHRTRSDGLHLLFKHDTLVRGTAGKIALGVDTRGAGNYVIWWPATGLPVLSDAPLVAWPNFLLAEFRPQPRSPITPSTPFNYCGDRWLRGLVRKVVTAPEGKRNSVLFWASCRAGEAIRDGRASEDFVTGVLLEAAAHAGLMLREAQLTIRSGVQRI